MEENLEQEYKAKGFWSTDRIVSISAIFVSLLTLITFINQNRLLQKQAALSVLPYLSVSSSYNTGDNCSFRWKITESDNLPSQLPKLQTHEY